MRFKATLMFLLMLCTTVDAAASVAWERVGRPGQARKIAGCSDGRLYAMNADRSLWVNRARGADSGWSLVGKLPDNAQRIVCAAGRIYFQNEAREIFQYVADGRFERVGRPFAAAEIAGSEDNTGFPVLWALNDDKTLWRNGNGGVDGQWRKVGQPRAAARIFATPDTIYALNGSKDFYRNRQGGDDEAWERLDRPGAAAEIAVVSNGPSTQPRFYALNTDYTLWEGTVTTWNIRLDRLVALDIDEDGDFSDGDEPYLIMVNFRSRFFTPGSTNVFVNRFENEDWANGIERGQTRNIPANMGVATFENVRILPIADIRAGTMPELIGSIVLAMESDAMPWGEVRNLVNSLTGALRTELVRLVEGGALGIGTTSAEANAEVTASLRRINESVTPNARDALRIGLNSYGDPDNFVGVHTFLFVTAEPTSAVSVPRLPGATTGFLQTRDPVSPVLDFRTSSIHYQVHARVF